MSFMPNTTPTPNWLYDVVMATLSDVELRVLLVVIRQTMGWMENKETGMRKTEDWIAHSELIKKTGKSSRGVSYAIDSLVKKGLIETRDVDGTVLIESETRKRKKIYYRLGDVSTANNAVTNLSQIKTGAIANNDTSLPQPLRNTKETITKETITKETMVIPEEFKAEMKVRHFKVLKETPNYPFEEDKDMKMLFHIHSTFPLISMLEVLKDWSLSKKISKPIMKGSKPRQEITNWMSFREKRRKELLVKEQTSWQKK